MAGPRFLHLQSTGNAIGPPYNIPAKDESISWSIDRGLGEYGRVTSVGPTNGFRVPRMPRGFFPAEIGTYQFGPANLLDGSISLLNFTAGEDLIIKIREYYELLPGFGPLVNNWIFTDWFSEARMNEVLLADLDDPEPSPFSFNGLPIAPRFNNDDEGGYYDICDVNPFDGHAQRRINLNNNPNAQGRTHGCELRRTTLYVPGRHSVNEYALGNASPVVACQEIRVAGGAPGYVIDPPAQNNNFLYWRENARCT